MSKWEIAGIGSLKQVETAVCGMKNIDLKSESHIFKKKNNFYLLEWSPFKNDEKCFDDEKIIKIFKFLS